MSWRCWLQTKDGAPACHGRTRGRAMGVFITVAEPDLQVLASQIAGVVSSTMLIVTVGFGVGLFLLMAVLKMLFHKSLSSMLMFFYMTLFALTALVVVNGNVDFLPMAFDSGGVTTGPITVPFIMALGVGVSAIRGDRHAADDSFGLVALCSIGPILAVMILGMVYNYLPYMILPLYATLVKIDRRLIEAAEDLGCNSMQVFSKVVLPLSVPGIRGLCGQCSRPQGSPAPGTPGWTPESTGWTATAHPSTGSGFSGCSG